MWDNSGGRFEVEDNVTFVNGTTPTVTSLTFAADASIAITAGSGLNDFSGIISKNAGSGNVSAGYIYYLNTSANWTKADNNNSVTQAKSLMAWSMGTNVANDGMMLQGFIYKASHGFTLGLPLYLSSTPGNLTTTVPTSGFVRIIGYAVNSNSIYIDPDKTFIQIS